VPLKLLEPVQIAYHVADPEQAAHGYARAFGWGPFFLLEHIALSSCLYRGSPAIFDHSSAYGQAGEMMIELISQHDDSPSVLRDLFARDAVGVHHVAHFVQDLPVALDQARADGCEIALDARTATGTRFAMLDTSSRLGHMIELYEGTDDLLKFYRYVRRASDGWNGAQPLRRLQR
jgi:catechol 2,3-dioxygenase-like lactoylglutathione lyase family enzyme